MIRTAVPAGSSSVYTRASFTVSSAASVQSLFLGADYDDGYVAWINGVEVFRSKEMPAGALAWNTAAALHESSNGQAPSYGALQNISAAGIPALHDGVNVLAVGVWNAAITSSDLVLVPRLSMDVTDVTSSVTRGPYLQLATPSSMVVRWRTGTATDGQVRYGLAPGSLTFSADSPVVTTEHIVMVSGLSPSTTYYYSVGTTAGPLAGGDLDHFFVTSPPSGTARPTRIWVLGDSGTANADARAVRDAYTAFTGASPTDLWLMLGDNAYPDGTDAQYQAAVFDIYPAMLRKAPLWPTLGNHDGHTADSATQSGPYYDIFTLPTGGEAGGMPSGTEAYYSFDRGNIHFICLESFETDRSPGGAMMTWLREDLASTLQEWIIAFWHHPPYSKGSHDSDVDLELIEMRQNALPILESAGVDLVLSGHSHSYERSFLIDGHYGSSSTFSQAMKKDGGDGRIDGTGAYLKPAGGPAPHEGAVYTVAGSSGQTSAGSLNHPAMYLSLSVLGSLAIDVQGSRLDAQFIDATGARRDHFTIEKGAGSLPLAPSSLAATAISSDEIDLAWLDKSSDETGFKVERSLDGSTWAEIATVGQNAGSHIDVGLAPLTTYFYRVRAFNPAGNSPYSNTASATTSGGPIDAVANGESTVSGTRTGSFLNTQAADTVYESIQEVQSGGKVSRRKSFLEHRWTIDVQPGSLITFHLKAYQSPSTDGDHFNFAYSTDGTTYTNMLAVTRTVDNGTYQTFSLPSSLAGRTFIRVRDSNRTPGKRSRDTVFVDHLFIRSE